MERIITLVRLAWARGSGVFLCAALLFWVVGGMGCEPPSCPQACPSGQTCVNGQCVSGESAGEVVGDGSTKDDPTQETTSPDGTVGPDSTLPKVYRWKKADSGVTADLWGASMPTKDLAWVVGDQGTILHSKDGGATWTRQASGVQVSLRSVAFINAKEGWIVGAGGTILQTADGGATWKATKSPVTDKLVRVFFPKADPDYGFAAGENFAILQSSDGGKSWQSVAKTLNVDLSGVFFFDQRTGMFAGDNGLVLTTEDGAKNFTTASTTTNEYINNVFFTTLTKGWAVGTGGLYMEGTTRGAGWTKRDLKTTKELFDIFFINDQRGWLVGADGLLWGTRDSGANWSPETNESVPTLHSISVVSEQAGVIVGKRGTIVAFLPVQAECTAGAERDCYSGPEGTKDVGLCKGGKQTCESNGQWSQCKGEVTPAGKEVCFNNVDDNCNGIPDEQDGCPICQDNSKQTCYLDEDGNPGPDNTQGIGVCKTGEQVCVGGKWGECVGSVFPGQEECNGQDDDCDGKVDEEAGLTPPDCEKNLGVCAGKKKSCIGGQWKACEAAQYGADYQETEDKCDDKDNDCDGIIDANCACPTEGEMRACYGGDAANKGVGECKDGVQTCTSGKWTSCVGQVLPRMEQCDTQKDENCNGQVDERSQAALACGNQRYLEVPDSAALQPDKQLTIEGWFQFLTLGRRDPSQTLISRSENGGYSLTISSATRQLTFRIFPKGGMDYVTVQAVYSGRISLSKWHHIAATYDGFVMRLWIDGKKVGEKAITTDIGYGPAVPLLVCAEAGPNGPEQRNPAYLTGNVAQVRISNQAVYSADFSPACNMAKEASTVALWLLDEASGDKCKDETGQHDAVRHAAYWREAVRCSGFVAGGCFPKP
ncbi:MAG: hypothetical protein H6728_07075 [Myxococcales bacterium]|nr:hypothetical protein [Myxococcales bacterium]